MARELPGRLPVEATGIDQHAADRDAVAAEPLGRRVHDDVAAVLDRAEQRRRGEGVVDHQRQLRLVGDRGDRRDVHHLEAGIAERLAVDEPRLGADSGAEAVVVARIHEARRDPEARQGVGEQIVRAAVDRARRHDVAALPHQRRDRQVQRGLARRGADRADAALERGEALLEHGDGRVGDPAVDVAGALEVEQRRGVVDALKHVGRRLVDRHRARAEHRVGVLAGVERERVEAQEFGIGHGRAEARAKSPGGKKSGGKKKGPLDGGP